MVRSLRNCLPVTKTRDSLSNAALEMERYVDAIETGGKGEAKEILFNRIAAAKAPSVYVIAYERWQGELARAGAVTRTFRVTGRMVVGLASETVIETALTLHPIYGVPYIPGDALKGLAAHYFAKMAEKDALADDHLRVLFGEQDKNRDAAAGYINWFDAWYIPDTAPDNRPLARDVLTVHHPYYYTGGKRRPPTDFDDPKPVPFVSARGDYLIAVTGPPAEWTEFAIDLLTRALGEWGVGGKTSSGEGRLRPAGAKPRIGTWVNPPGGAVVYSSSTSPDSPPPIHTLVTQINRLKAHEVKGRIDDLGRKWLALPDGVDISAVAAALRAKLATANVWNDVRWREKDWVKALVALLEP